MKLLALDSSGLTASVAVISDGQMTALYTTNYKKTHSQTILPMLDEITKMTELDLAEIDAIAVAAGPGSFTGLRIGSATAKGLGLALKKPIVEVPTVDALAYQLFGVQKLICPLMDARRNQVYTGLYTFREQEGESCFTVCMPQCALSVEEIVEKINESNQSVIFLGDGACVYQKQIKSLVKVPYEFAPAHCSRQSAGAVGGLGSLYFAEGKVVSAGEHRPEYLRLSQAERERLEKQKNAETAEK